jgi:ubiquinone/menaquinone biosynthesis C-methylase UbiE
MIDHFDLIAGFYDRMLGPPDTARLCELLKLPADGWMLDAGGGTGRVSSRLQGRIGNLVICDLSLSMLKKAQRKGRLNPVQAHIERLPFPAESFERILVVDALHHFCNQREAIADIIRVLKPGGRLVIEEPDISRLPVKLAAMAEKLALMGSHFLLPAEIRNLIASHGMAARIETDGHFTAWVLADR